MNTLILNVQGMSCMGCVRSVKGLVSALPGVGQIEVDLASGRVEIQHDPAQSDAQAIRSAINDGGYTVKD